MTAVVITIDDPVITLGGTEYTDQVEKVELACQIDESEVTTFVGDGAKVLTGGLESGGLKLDFLQDFTDNGLDEAMWTAYKAGTPIAWTLKYDSAATSATNPQYSGYLLVSKWTPISGAPKDVLKVGVDWPTSGAVTRTTA